ncbi:MULTISPECIES: hypothetical protein [Acidiplasma]|jgi:tRNA splicing endonuclease|uniref:Uncharacterized protein n=3 Tax=Acidiplasma TaxID=507753 RepID=A0A0Q0RLU7_9ARCH|nr:MULTISPECIES: hypothetical protein [Acidiplasma]KJE49290.1 hypothetical protein TZ01_04345 [Acidiplasma sp. MBA-1]KPV46264.1 hypothetical protein SE19_06320 [Acidiplasma aeolicum]KQB34537.1 hypothetical protein AOG54_04455 [Acidiplasma aeolicum]KQB36663.1 hypothetical protein AOG55_03385 [Acidiplasma cupricumulans]WMT54730.1 MAG: hypothetical protein RE470_07390 [Acidiplasma sp.]
MIEVDSIIKSEKFLRPAYDDASRFYIPIRSLYLSSKLGIKNDSEMDVEIISVYAIKDYLNTEDLKELSNIKMRMYLKPSGCGPNDGLFFTNDAAKLFEKHSIMEDKYRIKLVINKINGVNINEDGKLRFEF